MKVLVIMIPCNLDRVCAACSFHKFNVCSYCRKPCLPGEVYDLKHGFVEVHLHGVCDHRWII